MIYFDQENPNKYSALKEELVPFKIRLSDSFEPLTLARYGEGDGSYVFIKELVDHPDCQDCISYGIGNDPDGVSFEKAIIRSVEHLDMYDGSISEPPLRLEEGMAFFQTFVTEENFGDHLYDLPNTIVKMDIEGHEYDVLSDRNVELMSKNVWMISIEVHSLIEEIPEGWDLEPQLAAAKKDRDKILSFFKRLNKHFNLFHMHANNHSPRHVDLPDSLELSYVNKKIGLKNGIRQERFPIDKLDKPNYNGRPDYVLDWWI